MWERLLGNPADMTKENNETNDGRKKPYLTTTVHFQQCNSEDMYFIIIYKNSEFK